MDTATKIGIDAAKAASKRVVQKTGEAPGDFIGNKIADKITSVGKPIEKEKERTKGIEEIYIPTEKKNRLLMILDCFEYKIYFFYIKIEFQKIVNFLDTTSDDKNLPRFINKKSITVYGQSGGNYNVNKEIRIKI